MKRGFVGWLAAMAVDIVRAHIVELVAGDVVRRAERAERRAEIAETLERVAQEELHTARDSERQKARDSEREKVVFWLRMEALERAVDGNHDARLVLDQAAQAIEDGALASVLTVPSPS